MVVGIYLDWGKMMSELKLTDREWKSFFIGGKQGIFEIKATKSGIDKNKLKTSDNGITPYITRTDLDNGINLFVPDEQMPKYKKDNGNAITIGLDTQTVFYQRNAFWTGQNIQVLRNQNLNYWVAMFVIPLLKIQMRKFSWGSTGATLGRLNRTKIMLPENADGEPDWQFMEDFIKQKEQKQRKQLRDYYADKALNLMLSGSLKDRKWANFDIKDIFHTYEGQKGLQTYTGAYVSKQLLSDGVMPRITVKDTLNGIDSFCYSKDKNFRFFKNFISISFLGSVFYHPYEASLDMKVHALIPLEIELNPYIAKFLISVIKNSIVFLSYGNQLSSTDLPKVKILLPISSEGKPDWQFMENFMRQIEQNKIQTLLKYYNSLNYMENCGGG